MNMPIVTIKGCSTVRPCEETWTGTMALSEWDQTGCLTHVRTIFFYQPPNTWLSAPSAIVDTLKLSLSKALVPFYPLAGRLQWIGNGRLQLQCNAVGARFIEAECDSSFNDLAGDSYLSYQPSNLFPSVDYSLPIQELPLFLVQLTTFKCGGIGIGIANSHAVVDGAGAFYFISEWARLARGKPLQAAPFLNRSVFRAGQPPLLTPPPSLDDYPQYKNLPLLLGQLDNSEERNKKTTKAMLRIMKSQMEQLRKMANDKPMARAFSRYETICGHMWRTACKARGLKQEQPTSLIIVVDSRSRIRPHMPREYFGTATFDVIAQSVVGDLLLKPLRFAASKVREAIEKVTNEYVMSGIELLKNQNDLTKFQDIHKDGPSFDGNPNLEIVSWLSLPIHGFDFGWGNEEHMGLGSHVSDGNSVLLPSFEEDGSIFVSMCLQEVHMNAFKKHFYEDIKEMCEYI
ncbi:hypothetical protein QN277_019820 [Acacia crassicarpa]|uniref:Spermidine hydroxycinnamoyl transferase n=2 Tax=Acacia crassicarpa TaxID=499986 RepID=A0AAE1JI95_9FABA|nr:hypothetical protein QN277_019820 [Acacia crassicarpa]